MKDMVKKDKYLTPDETLRLLIGDRYKNMKFPPSFRWLLELGEHDQNGRS